MNKEDALKYNIIYFWRNRTQLGGHFCTVCIVKYYQIAEHDKYVKYKIHLCIICEVIQSNETNSA